MIRSRLALRWRRWWRDRSARVAAVLIAAAASLAAAQGPTVEISHRARALHPGEVVVLEVRASESFASVRATAFGSTIRFFAVTADGLWLGLVGIDLTADAGNHPVLLVATTADGAAFRRHYTLVVAAKEFPTRQLTVAPNFVSPPSEVLDRIQREAQRVASIFRVSSAERLWSGGFLEPVPGNATSSFGRRSVFNGQPRSPHSGTDFRAAEGTPVQAPSGGRVVLTGDQYFSGQVVILDHGWGLYSYFAHLSSIDVAEGDVVGPGAVLGKVGATGRVTGPHLHWTVRLNEARVDPLSLMEMFPEP